MVSGIPLLLVLRTRMGDPHVYVVFWALSRSCCICPPSALPKPTRTLLHAGYIRLVHPEPKEVKLLIGCQQILKHTSVCRHGLNNSVVNC